LWAARVQTQEASVRFIMMWAVGVPVLVLVVLLLTGVV
jgi:hypothetical protein